MTKKTNRTLSWHGSRNTAASEYARLREEILDRMVLIRRRLDQHKATQATDPRNWGFVGDLNEIDNLLSRVQGFMASTKDGTQDAETGTRRSN